MTDDRLVTGVQVMAIYVTDLERARSFYVDQLGLTFKEDMSPGVLLKAGDFTLYLEGGRSRRAEAGMDGATVSIVFATTSIGAAFEKLEQTDVTVVQELQLYGKQFAMFRIADPDGNVIEFAGTP